MTIALVPLGLLVALGLKVAHDRREYGRRLREEREEFVAYVDRYAAEWEWMR